MRVVGYTRVSSEGQAEEGWSLDAQERAITLHAQAHNWEVVAWYRDEGRSARSEKLDKRPAFAQMVADAEAGKFDSIIVHKLDRFSRNLLVTIDTLGKLEQVGVGFASVTESIDLATPIGKLMLSMLASLAAFYSDNLSAETRKGKQERKRQGWWNGLLPYGVSTNQAGIPVLDERPWACNIATRAELAPADGLRLAFQLASEGNTDRQVARALNDVGYLTSGNRGANRFTKDSVRAILTNRFYLGELPDGEDTLPGRHGVLIDPALFAQARARRERIGSRRLTGIGTKRQPWALSGIATCAYCGRSLTTSGNGTGRRRVQCQGRVQGLGCTAVTFYADRLDEQIAVTLETFTIPSPMRADLVRQAIASAGKDRSGITTTRQRLEGQLARLQDLYLEGDLSKPQYMERRALVQRDLAALPLPVEMGGTEAEALTGFLADVGGAWRVATDMEKTGLPGPFSARFLWQTERP